MKKIICIAITSIIGHLSIGQGIGVGTTTPDPSAALEVSSVTQGMLVPRMTTAQRITISNAANGLLVYDITTGTFWFYNDGWLELIDSAHREVYRSAPDKIYAGMTDQVGLGISNPLNKLDIDAANYRDGSHATGRPLYITGDIQAGSNGIEFRHYNGTQGIGFGYNTIYATGSNTEQDLGLASKGPGGNLLFQTNGMERMRINGSGYVGIGINDPQAPLQFNNLLLNRKIVLYDVLNNDHQFFGFGVNGDGTLRYQTAVHDNDHVFYSGSDATSSLELMRITGYGNIGIGTSVPLQRLHVEGNAYISQNIGIGTITPNAPIQLANTVANRKVVLYDEFNNDNQYFGLGINPYAMRYQVSGPESNHIFYAGTSPTTSNELMRIKGNGNVDVVGNLEIGYVQVIGSWVLVSPLSWAFATCDCPSGTVVLGGGYNNEAQAMRTKDNGASSNTQWGAYTYNPDAFTAYNTRATAICARLAN